MSHDPDLIEAVAARLKLLERALGRSGMDICRDTGIGQSAWSQYRNSARRRLITIDAARKLKDAYPVTLEWIYRGDLRDVGHELALKLERLTTTPEITETACAGAPAPPAPPR